MECTVTNQPVYPLWNQLQQGCQSAKSNGAKLTQYVQDHPYKAAGKPAAGLTLTAICSSVLAAPECCVPYSISSQLDKMKGSLQQVNEVVQYEIKTLIAGATSAFCINKFGSYLMPQQSNPNLLFTAFTFLTTVFPISSTLKTTMVAVSACAVANQYPKFGLLSLVVLLLLLPCLEFRILSLFSF